MDCYPAGVLAQVEVCEAARKGDLPALQKLLDEGVPVKSMACDDVS